MRSIRLNKGEGSKDFISRFMREMEADLPDINQRLSAAQAVFSHSLTPGFSINEDLSTIAQQWLKDHAEPSKPQPALLNIRHLMSNLIQRKKLDGKEHLVIPTILIVEGVHNDVFYSASELAKFPDSWNGRPVVIDHPSLNDKPISASKPDILEKQTVGVIYNTQFEDGKLKAEVWLDINKTKRVSLKLWNMIQNEEKIEVSTGLFTECDGMEGVWNNEKFVGSVYNYRPDHLAILPDSIGACSWNDGGGMPRINEVEETGMKLEKLLNLMSAKMSKLSKNEKSHDEVHRALSMKLNPPVQVPAPSSSAGAGFSYVQAVYDDYFVYGKDTAEGLKLYQQDYSMDSKGEVTLEGDPEEVEQEISFVPVTKNESKAGSDAGAKERSPAMDREARIQALLAMNGQWKETDVKTLTEMPEEAFAKVEAEALSKKAEVKPEVKPVANVEKPVEKTEIAPVVTPVEVPETLESVLSGIKNNELKETISRAVARDVEIKGNLIKSIMANKNSKFTEAELSAKPMNELEKLVALMAIVVEQKPVEPVLDFSARVPAVNADHADEVPAMPKLFANKKQGEKKS